MTHYYTDEKQVQVVIALLKAHGIRKIIASPGTTNMTFVMSLKSDPHFKLFSAVDERSAAYMACGLAEECGEPVVISCTGATASRNYMPGLTEAHYRKLPVLAITATRPLSEVGHHTAQVIDRSVFPKDTVVHSVSLPVIKDAEDQWDCEIKANRAILALTHRGGGPVHINLPTTYCRSYDTKKLPECRIIQRIGPDSGFPALPKGGRVGIFVGSHAVMPAELTSAIDRFCAVYNGAVFCDHTSGYRGAYRVAFSIVGCQQTFDTSGFYPDVLIHIGEITGDYYLRVSAGQVWRVCEDGEIRDKFRKLRYVFDMSERRFFDHYTRQSGGGQEDRYLQECLACVERMHAKIPKLPFSNISIARRLAPHIPPGAVLHFGILNSLRAWNFFELPAGVAAMCNVGGFGIDGCVSSLIGASLADRNKLYFGVIGDLAFFYDMNVLGNRHIGNNVRILLINNGKGMEFGFSFHPAALFGAEADAFVAAKGHFGRQSRQLVKNFAENLGFEYLSAANEQELEEVYERFMTPELTERPVLLEVFTNDDEESQAMDLMMSLEKDIKSEVVNLARQAIGAKGIKVLKKLTKG